jgi:hypothetical protein
LNAPAKNAAAPRLAPVPDTADRPSEAAPRKPPEPLKGDTVRLLEHVQNRWSTVFAAGSLASDYEDPALWCATNDFTAYDTCVGPTGDTRFWREYLCISALPGCTRFKLLREVALPPRESDTERRMPPGYRLRVGTPEEEQRGDMYMIDRKDHPDGLDDQIGLNRGLQHQSAEQAFRWWMDHAVMRGR